MKKFLMTIAAAFAAVSMNAQVYVGGGLNLSSTSYDGNSTSKITITPEVGYVLDENSALGLGLAFGTSGKDATKQTVFGVNPYYRYNVVKTEKVNLFLDGSFTFMNYKGDGISNEDAKLNEWSIGIRPGVAVALNDKLSFVSTMGLLGYKSSKPDGGEATNTFGLMNFNTLGLNFGLYYNF